MKRLIVAFFMIFSILSVSTGASAGSGIGWSSAIDQKNKPVPTPPAITLQGSGIGW
ncbi:hypothetical protein [Brevibacillus sp. FIR094]|uniref:hypothetical protein n=1 Tax=Brevibacillus sp. FIR094 TaxID=3134809 RepID=UPI003D23B194